MHGADVQKSVGRGHGAAGTQAGRKHVHPDRARAGTPLSARVDELLRLLVTGQLHKTLRQCLVLEPAKPARVVFFSGDLLLFRTFVWN